MKNKTEIPDYEKEEYLVTLKTGETVTCWPNAGRFNALDGSGREFWMEDITQYVIKEELPADNLIINESVEINPPGHKPIHKVDRWTVTKKGN